VIDCEPPDGLADVSTTTSVRSHGEVPDASSTCDNKLLTSIQKVADPQKSKNLENKDVAGVLFPHDFSSEAQNIGISLGDFSH
jgi:hypothetical protein